ncbi:MAG: ATP-binding protein [Candidatus Sericytochromatia bacterium]|nr:ATP-binding protein [Candidatus Sericytochromatia bacterium]
MAKNKLFERRALADLRSWARKEERKPLVLRGARQVGKTSLVQLFAREFDTYLELNLERTQDAQLFEHSLSIQALYQAILLAKQKTPKGKVLLFIDEIQASPLAVEQLRFFYENLPEVHVIAAGSLLEVVLDQKEVAFPVGRVEMLWLKPLCFEEYLAAMGHEQALEAYHTLPCPDYALPTLFRHFHQYTLIGGMPEIVASYQVTGQIMALNGHYQSLLTAYLDDIPKYARNATSRHILRHCAETAPYEAGSRIHFAGFGRSDYGSREVGEALRTLERAQLLYLLYPSTDIEIPIRPDFKKSPRLQFLDTGLLNYFVGLQNHYFGQENLHGFYRGLIAEHIVGQEMLAQAVNPLQKLCFWVREKKQSNAEVDFVLQHGEFIIPIEVKAGASGTLRSLHQFIDVAPHALAVRLYHGPYQIQESVTPAGNTFNLYNLPYFLAGKISAYLDFWIK